MTRLNQRSRILFGVAALLLGLTFLFPLWKIEIWAPQYPEGLFMYIWTSKITGDIRNINILNHYIGMSAIHPEGFLELQYFPIIFGVLMGTGLAAAAWGRRVGLHIWTFALLTFAVVAFYDFYRWEYEYGHNLNPDAAIKMDDMTYSPPLIGYKELLNISAYSLPGIAGYGFAIAVVLASILSFLEIRAGRLKKTAQGTAAVVSMLFLFGACNANKAEPIVWGHDECHSCKMTMTDKRFGAEAVNSKGKAFKFDSIECLSEYLKSNEGQKLNLYFVDGTHPGELIAEEKAVFTVFDHLRSPMGKGIVAGTSLETIQKTYATNTSTGNTEHYQWNQLKSRLQSL